MLKDRLYEDLKTAMRSGDVVRRSVIRYVRSEIKNEEIAIQADLDDDGVIRVLGRQVSQRRDSIDAFTNANRKDLAGNEKSELEILLEYLPKQMSREEIKNLVVNTLEEMDNEGPIEPGKVMSIIMPKVKGKAEGREVNTVVRDLLDGGIV